MKRKLFLAATAAMCSMTDLAMAADTCDDVKRHNDLGNDTGGALTSISAGFGSGGAGGITSMTSTKTADIALASPLNTDLIDTAGAGAGHITPS